MPASITPSYPPTLTQSSLSKPTTSLQQPRPPWTIFSPSSPLPPNTTLQPLTPSLVPSYRRLLTAHLPISYPPKFYALSTTQPHESGTSALCITLDPTSTTTPVFASSNNEPQVIAAIQARLEPSPPQAPHHAASNNQEDGGWHLYIQTLTTASPHRSLGLASTLLSALITRAIQIWGDRRIESVYAHVWEVNDDALDWYLKRRFKREGGKCEGYYRKLRPGGAWVVRRKISTTDYLAAKEGAGMNEDRIGSTRGLTGESGTDTKEEGEGKDTGRKVPD